MSLAVQHMVLRLGALCVLCLSAPVLAASDHASGDGSDADNERLQAGVFPAEPVLASGETLREPYHPFFDIDWSTSLRGTYTEGTGGERFDVRLVPTISFDHQGSRSAINITGSAEMVRPRDEKIDVSALRLDLSGGYQLDSVTALQANANLTLTQDIAGTPGVGSDVLVAPEERSAGFDLGIARQFGRFNVGVTGAVQRSVYGDTVRSDGTVFDNSDQDVWSLDTGLRLGLQATPIFEVFTQASLGRDVFDQPSSVLLIKTDANDASIEGGVTGRWNDRLEATVSTGLNLRRFDDESLGEVTSRLYDASVTYRPDPTWEFRAGFSTIVAPPGPGGSGTTRVEYAADLDVAYKVNSWLDLRAQANWSTARFAGSSETERGYGWGVGGDYNVNAHTAVTADYHYGKTRNSTDGVEDAHRISMGVTVSR
ncbi:outer membrane beta-barrel protein [Devosia submarina]|uniref:outer membrane beta-barrel protein n=1 Tax=Devosia submarina TaxID=1173082 RepID=UPI0013003C50|nr:outer membrane beta-barrel protein [Devosia submarina]